MGKILDKIINKISKIDWYHQAAASKLYSISVPWASLSDLYVFGKPIPSNFRGAIIYQYDDYVEMYWPRKKARDVAYYYLTRQKRNSDFVSNLQKNWYKKHIGPYRELVKSLSKNNFRSWSNQELILKYFYFCEKTYLLWREVIFLDSYDMHGDAILEDAASEERNNPSFDELHLLTEPDKLSILQTEKKELLSIVSLVLSNKKLKRQVLKARRNGIMQVSKELVQVLKNHSGKYYWMYNDYAVIKKLDEDFFFNEVRKLVLNKKLLSQERASLVRASKIAREKKVLLKSGRFSTEFKNIIFFLSKLTSLRDSRKAYNQITNAVLSDFINEFSKRSGEKLEIFEQLFWREIVQFMQNSKSRKKLTTIARKRMSGAVFLDITNVHRQGSVFYGKEAKKIVEYLDRATSGKELTGRIAYPGMVRGRVKKILSQKDFSKMVRGDILVAPNTRPEYVPIMKLASAILTEEGGITSHAAIISRELKTPSIVGIQGVLIGLKNGDLVEVDAKKGKVTKIG